MTNPVGRPRKYATDEERKQAIRESKRNYMRRIRAANNGKSVLSGSEEHPEEPPQSQDS